MTKGRFTLDERAREHYGLERAEVDVETVIERVHPADRDRLRAEIARTQDAAAVDSMAITHRVLVSSGAERWLSVHLGFVREGDGDGRHSVLVYATTQDITERRLAEDAIQRFVKGSPSVIYATDADSGRRAVGQRQPRTR